MRATSAWMRAALVLTATGVAIGAAGCNELTGVDQFVESPCYPLPPSQCGVGDGGADGDATTQEAGADGARVDSSDAGDGASDSGAVIADAEGGTPSEGGEAGCPTGDLSCGGGCVPNDAHHCGTCTHDCTALPNVSGQVTCGAGGVCEYDAGACASGYAHCGDGGPDQGCETQINASPNCGACGTLCSGGTPDCSGSGSTTYSCASGCGAGETLCGSTCTNTTGDRNNCGACGTQCGTQVQHATPACSGGMCGYACNNGYSKCNGECVDYSSDPANCGSCGNGCTGGKTCSGGSCACPAGTLDCAGTCEMPAPQNGCGAGGTCGSACSGPTAGTGSASCNGASCSLSCTGSTPDHCGTACVDTSSDGKNCGACGHDCLGGMCTGGMCQPVTLASRSADAGAGQILNGGPMAIDAANIYWSWWQPSGGVVFSCSKTTGCAGGGNPVYTAPAIEPITNTAIEQYGLVTPGSGAYQGFLFTLNSTFGTDCSGTSQLVDITKSPPASTAATVTLDYPAGLAFDVTQNLVYALDSNSGTLYRMQPNGTTFSTVLTGLKPTLAAFGIGIDSHNVYVPDCGNNRVVSCPLSSASCSPAPVMNVACPVLAYSDGTYVWAVAGSPPSILRCNVGDNCGTGPVSIADHLTTSGVYGWTVVADGTYVYLTIQAAAGQILRCPIGGCSGAPTLMANAPYPVGIVTDDTAIYWSDQTRVQKLAK